MYHPLSLESPSEELSPSRRSPYPKHHLPLHHLSASSRDTASSSSASSDDTTTTGASSFISRDPLYFETEPIYSDAYTPHIKRRKEPLYHETMPDYPPSSTPANSNINNMNNRRLSTAPRKSITPPQTLSRRPTILGDSPPPVPTSRRPSGAISPMSFSGNNSFVESGGGGSTMENTNV